MENKMAAAAAETAAPAEGKKTNGAVVVVAAESNKSGFYIYIGPNIKGLIQTGTIYRGNLAQALQAAAPAIKKYPLVRTLIVSGDALPMAWRMLKEPGNALYANYRKLAGK
ncbi:MAG: hypothetical protein K2O18_07110 [Oscillospiraceae bacterium]|nr:hypothetical protein [Oscillospiraceae bacterium]